MAGRDPAIQQTRVGAPIFVVARRTPHGWMGGSRPPMAKWDKRFDLKQTRFWERRDARYLCAPRSSGEKLVKMGHQPLGLISPSTTTQLLGNTKYGQVPQLSFPFG